MIWKKTQHLISQNTMTLKERGHNPSTEVPNQRVTKRERETNKSANKHSFNKTQAGNTGSITILKRRGAHTSHGLKNSIKNTTLVKRAP